MWDRLPAFLYPTSHFVTLPCQLVWQEAKIRKLDTAKFENIHTASKAELDILASLKERFLIGKA